MNAYFLTQETLAKFFSARNSVQVTASALLKVVFARKGGKAKTVLPLIVKKTVVHMANATKQQADASVTKAMLEMIVNQ